MTGQGMAGVPAPETDVVTLLTQQHGDIRNLFDIVEASTGQERRDAFRSLVSLLAVHETAEEELVHPYARSAFAGGDQVVQERLREEQEAREALSRIDGMGTDDPKFLAELDSLRTMVVAHARAEERYEFNQVRRVIDSPRLARMARGVKAATATAPARPHPGMEIGMAQASPGPLATVMDRAREAVREAMEQDG